MQVSIAGAGITGRCVAATLARRGADVTLYDPRPSDHTEGSSHGRSRIVRQAYPEPFWTKILAEGYDDWRVLEQWADEALVNEVGLWYLGPADHEELATGREGLDACGVAYDWVTTGTDTLRLHPGEAAITTPRAGWVNADQARAAALRVAQVAGVREVRAHLDQPAPEGCTVWTVGPWIAAKLPQLGLRVTRQWAVYLRGHHEGPVWIEAADDHPYGFPNEPGEATVKVALHSPGPDTTPGSAREPDPAIVARTAEAARHRLPQCTGEVVDVVPCLYTNAKDDAFRIFWLNERELVVAACSGHAFKFGPWLGRFVADVLQGHEDLANWPEFQP
ncbi:MAG: FAD-dependent oxidoreductase [Armatimonadota bacterium]|jgi:sarcosine oxidase